MKLDFVVQDSFHKSYDKDYLTALKEISGNEWGLGLTNKKKFVAE